MTTNAIYTDLSGYYDLMCADIDYRTQSQGVRRLHQLFGNGGLNHLDLACGTGPHIRHFLDGGYRSTGLDIQPSMLDIAAQRCPEARFMCQDMGAFKVSAPVDLITCFLYSIHYNAGIEQLKTCFARVHEALADGGMFCFNSVDRHSIDNNLSVGHKVTQGANQFAFRSAWHYPGEGQRQSLRLRIDKTCDGVTQSWRDEHPMVATSFNELLALLKPWFEVHMFEHDYQRIAAWDGVSGNAIFVCVKTTD